MEDAFPARLPSLVMLRAFEAVGRHGSMSSAAGELNVTHGAISRQIAALEQLMETQLVRRRSRGVELTEAGTFFFHGVAAGFDRIRSAVEHLRQERRQQRRVILTTLPSFAARWLLPRLARFHAEQSDIDVDVRSDTALCDLRDPTFDFAIRYGRGHWPDTEARRLLSVNAYPLCSPAFIARHGLPQRPEDLIRLPLIHNVTKQWWLDWLLAAGVRVSKLPGGIIVDEYGLALQHALEGHGVVLGREPLVGRELESGALIRLFDVAVTPAFAYYIVRDARRHASAEADTLIEWLLADAASGS